MDDDPRIALGRKVESARIAHRWSKEEVARRAKVSSITYKRIADGLGVRDVSRYAVLDALGLDDAGNPREPAANDLEVRIARVMASDLGDDLKAEIIKTWRREAGDGNDGSAAPIAN